MQTAVKKAARVIFWTGFIEIERKGAGSAPNIIRPGAPGRFDISALPRRLMSAGQVSDLRPSRDDYSCGAVTDFHRLP